MHRKSLKGGEKTTTTEDLILHLETKLQWSIERKTNQPRALE
jgi:hypothetical protein